MSQRTPAWLVFVVMIVIVFVTRLALPPHVSSDSTSYLEAMKVLVSGDTPEGFVPNRILTTYLGLETVVWTAGAITGDILWAWYAINSIFFVLGLAAFFFFLRDFFEDDTVAWLGTLLLATNYAVLSFGLNYLMDMGGWAFYLITLWASYRYYLTRRVSYFVWGALFVGFGGLFKEYAFLALIPLLGAVALRDYKKPWVLVRHALQTLVLVAIPVGFAWWMVQSSFGYSYADWFGFNETRYGASYASRIWEYVKVFGSLFTVGWFLALPGLILFLKKGKQLLGRDRMILMTLVFVSGLPVFLWPAITQRVFLISVVFLVMLACLFMKRYEKWLPYMLPVIILYVLAGYTMDSYILPWVSLDSMLGKA